ncbi:MAG: hypothetical protein LBB65_02510 [Burkholderiales bacterium]|jgi:hypothetical protein|nr:hypothetical protein [Burkholderiales bacterium]
METNNWKLLSVYALIALAVTGCGGDGNSGGKPPSAGDKKLLSRVVTEGQGERIFQYDDQNRLIADSQLGDGNKIEYQGEDSRPALVTHGASYSGGECPSMKPVVYTEYQYGEDDLLNGAPTKYYQTQTLDQNRNPCGYGVYPRYYLNSDDRKIAYGYTYGPFYGNDASTVFHPESSPYSIVLVYDHNGNLLEKEATFEGFMTRITATCEYTYDDKKNSASGMATPLWWFGVGDPIEIGDLTEWDDDSSLLFANTNNPLKSTCKTVRPYDDSSSTETYNYTYDQDGYPTAADVTVTSRDFQGVEATTSYKRVFEYIAAH